LADARRSLARLVREHGETLLGLAIVAVSIFGAYVLWQAAEMADRSADFDQRGRQAAIIAGQNRARIRSAISYETRLFAAFTDHVATADALDADAARRPRGGPLAASMHRDARIERAIARRLEVPFQALQYVPTTLRGGDVRPEYDSRSERRFLLSFDPSLSDLAPKALVRAAGKARNRRFWLTAVDTIVIAGLFFLTIALLSIRPRLRRALAAVGGLCAVGAIVVLLVVQWASEVPTL